MDTLHSGLPTCSSRWTFAAAKPRLPSSVQLTLDLHFVPEGRASSGDERAVTLGDLRRLGTKPTELARLLWGQRYDRVVVLEDDLQQSAVQAAALALGGLARGGHPLLLL